MAEKSKPTGFSKGLIPSTLHLIRGSIFKLGYLLPPPAVYAICKSVHLITSP